MPLRRENVLVASNASYSGTAREAELPVVYNVIVTDSNFRGLSIVPSRSSEMGLISYPRQIPDLVLVMYIAYGLSIQGGRRSTLA